MEDAENLIKVDLPYYQIIKFSTYSHKFVQEIERCLVL